MVQYVCGFTGPVGEMARHLGVRGTALRDMAEMGLPVPRGFIVSDVACRRFLETGDIPGDAWEQIEVAVARLGRAGVGRPVLLAVRASPAESMPGVLDSARYIGATRDSLRDVAAWASARAAGRIRYGFLESMGRLRAIAPARLAAVVADVVGPEPTREWSEAEVDAVCDAYERLIVDESQRPIPSDGLDQLREAIESVFVSWERPPAQRHRRSHGISDDLGLAVVVHAMVLGEVDDRSGAGVAFSRDPVSGNPEPVVSYRQGSSRSPDVDAPIGGIDGSPADDDLDTITRALRTLEREWRRPIRIDFVCEQGRLWIIEARPAKCGAPGAVRIAVDMVDEELMTPRAAVAAIDLDQLDEMLHPRIGIIELPQPIGGGTATSPGAAAGRAVFSAAAAIAMAEAGQRPVLVLRETTPEDLDGVVAAAGVVASHGGGTSHTAVAARATGTPAVTGVSDMYVARDHVRIRDAVITPGDPVTIDGSTGAVYWGLLPIDPPPARAYLNRLLSWADEIRRLGVWANADTPRAARAARAAGAEGLGLARSEYMFRGERLEVVRRILLSEDARERADALETLETNQIGDFERLLEVMDGLPVVVRLLDPPLHEFLPDRVDIEAELAERRAAGQPTADLERLEDAVEQWSEANPMLGLRGVRLAVVTPEIYRVQVLAALEAVRRRLDAGGDPRLELMIPFVGSVAEFHLVRDLIEEEVHNAGRLLEITVGTMIELPRAALIADELALESDFFSFGTNDLTQTTLGMSRDDAEEAFLHTYVERGLLDANPFQTIDVGGVGKLMEQAISTARAVNPGLEIGVCGEHGGDPRSIDYFDRWGVDYVSCSPPRLPIARLAAAQARLHNDPVG